MDFSLMESSLMEYSLVDYWLLTIVLRIFENSDLKQVQYKKQLKSIDLNTTNVMKFKRTFKDTYWRAQFESLGHYLLELTTD